jgi:FtsH-binding integral membrane protein
VALQLYTLEDIGMLNSGVYERAGEDHMSRHLFYFAIGGLLTWGFVLTGIVSTLTADWQPTLGVFLIVGLAVPFVGILLNISRSAFASFIGYNLVVGGLAAILGPALTVMELARPGIVVETAVLTGAVTCIMGFTGTMFPRFYSWIGGMLFGALSGLLFVMVLGIFIPALAQMTAVHYIAAGIFALYVGFDMWRASEIPATMYNAMDVTTSLYLDILNLFLQLGSIIADIGGGILDIGSDLDFGGGD